MSKYISVDLKGQTRICIMFFDFVIKIPRLNIANDSFHGKVYGFLTGWKNNRYEYKWSKVDIHPFLNPVIFSFLFSIITVYRRGDDITMEEFLKLDKDDYNFGGFEFKIDSFKRVGEDIKVVDYDGSCLIDP